MPQDGKYPHPVLARERYQLVHGLENAGHPPDWVYAGHRARHCLAHPRPQVGTGHNLAIVFWIMANSYWMLSEFLGFAKRMVIHKKPGNLQSVFRAISKPARRLQGGQLPLTQPPSKHFMLVNYY